LGHIQRLLFAIIKHATDHIKLKMGFIAQKVHQILNAGNRSTRLVRWPIPINDNEYFGFGVHEKFKVQNYIAMQLFTSGFTKFLGWLEIGLNQRLKIASDTHIELPFTQALFHFTKIGAF
jgi:hypothetical protein